jgi:hypothetical protein
MARPRSWPDHELVLALQICTSTTEVCCWLGLRQGGPTVLGLVAHAERLGLEMPMNPKHGDGREREPYVLSLPLLRSLCRE